MLELFEVSHLIVEFVYNPFEEILLSDDEGFLCID